MNRKMKLIGVLLISTTLTTGCVTNSGTKQYANKSDVCYPQRKPLLAVEDKFNKSLVTGAIAGAVIGGIIGGIFSKNKAKGVAVGALAGGAAGLAAGYLKAKHDKKLSQDQIISEIDGDTRKDISELNNTTGTVKRLTDCRFQQLAAVRIGVENGTIQKKEVANRLKAIKTLMAEDQNLINKILDSSNKRLAAYAEADAETQKIEKAALIGNANSIKWYTPSNNNSSSNLAASETYYSSANVNVRSGPSTSNRVVGSLAANEKVEVLGNASGAFDWKKIKFNDQTAYVYSSLLKKTKTYSAPQTSTASKGLVDPQMVDPVSTGNVHQQAAVSKSTVEAVSDARYAQLEAELNEIALLSGTDQISKTPSLKIANG